MARPRKDQQVDIPVRAIAETLRLVEDCGVSALTLADVATAVGCRAPALYAYFANKDALLLAAHDEGFHMMLREKLAVAARNADSGLDRLREGGRAYLRFAFERPELYRLMFSPPTGDGLTGRPFDRDPGAQCLTVLRAAVVACQEQGYLPGADAGAMAFTLWSAVHGAAILVLQRRAPVASGEEPEAYAFSVVDTLMAFIAATRLPSSAPSA